MLLPSVDREQLASVGPGRALAFGQWLCPE